MRPAPNQTPISGTCKTTPRRGCNGLGEQVEDFAIILVCEIARRIAARLAETSLRGGTSRRHYPKGEQSRIETTTGAAAVDLMHGLLVWVVMGVIASLPPSAFIFRLRR